MHPSTNSCRPVWILARLTTCGGKRCRGLNVQGYRWPRREIIRHRFLALSTVDDLRYRLQYSARLCLRVSCKSASLSSSRRRRSGGGSRIRPAKRKGMKSVTLHLHRKVWNDLTKERWSYASCDNFFTRALLCGLDLDAFADRNWICQKLTNRCNKRPLEKSHLVHPIFEVFADPGHIFALSLSRRQA
ncbi:hypothetical protein BJX66DRAFT_23113 [Aspergillus keveii]|uniref:Uncharacterized protein n=1 Tax=Aspergillus keveii TaxID=714993 RepID=A0ABR4GJJ7_9EURO